MELESFARTLATAIREAVLPMFGHPDARRRAGTAAGGDPTFAIDEVAERTAQALVEQRGDVAYFTEDAGLRTLGRPEGLLLLDPVDGSRPAVAGYETCGVSVAVAPFGEGVTMADVRYGCVVEIATGAVFEARRGGGARAEGAEIRPSGATEPRGMLWAGGFRGQPVVPTAVALEDLFDAPDAEGAFFDQGSAAYSLTRLATGQLDAYVDVGQALVEEIPGTEGRFREVGGGHLLNTTTYDTAAGYLLLEELGLPVTDARGGPVGEVPLFAEDGAASLVSTVAACTPELHEALLEAVSRGIARLRSGA
ncbi:MAG TPA: inositol monophosphatase family protein [Actinomycetota bacterium]